MYYRLFRLMPIITEQKTKINVTLPKGDVHAQMEVFYNPIMKSNRNISILLLNSIANTQMNIADPLAGSGIRSLRFLQELENGKIKELFVNDFKDNFKNVFQKNLTLNKIKAKNIEVSTQDAVLFLFQQQGFDYIDIDPFGSPNPFLAGAIARISRAGILAITATDTAALTGTYVKATRRKYWAEPLRNYLMHEIGLRILIRRVQLQGVQFEKALTPILSYHKDHYLRIYLRSERSKEKCDEIINQHRYFLFCHSCSAFKTSVFNIETCSCGKVFTFAGPLWTGKLFDEELVSKMVKNNPFPEESKFLNLLAEEAGKDIVGFYDLHAAARTYKRQPPKMEEALREVHGVRTHFSPTGIKTELGIKDILRIFHQNSSK